jgi:hypothetical protein
VVFRYCDLLARRQQYVLRSTRVLHVCEFSKREPSLTLCHSLPTFCVSDAQRPPCQGFLRTVPELHVVSLGHPDKASHMAKTVQIRGSPQHHLVLLAPEN